MPSIAERLRKAGATQDLCLVASAAKKLWCTCRRNPTVKTESFHNKPLKNQVIFGEFVTEAFYMTAPEGRNSERCQRI